MKTVIEINQNSAQIKTSVIQQTADCVVNQINKQIKPKCLKEGRRVEIN